MGKEAYIWNALFLSALIIFPISCKKETSHPDPVADIEGKIYKTVKIGTQVWMAENLKTTRLNDGTDVPLATDASTWSNLTTPGYCWYLNDADSFKDVYGAIYNGYTAETGKLCPVGWHIPSKEDWQILRGFLGDSTKAGGKLKEAGTLHWLAPNKGTDNSSGFSALPSGIRYFEGTFASILSYTCFWSDTETGDGDNWYVALYFAEASFIIDHRNKKHGFSVRCLKD
jgi:uncharacterized protein (TIGR02145 family)